MEFQYNTRVVDFDGNLTPLKYNLDDRKATYLYKEESHTIDVNPLTPYDDIIRHIADNMPDQFKY